ncbi:MAG: hypothetical protein JST85_04020 [Acidobacteria bacterium]|nr:hypothetical protein [Acidobacteriota bacterium]
MEKVLTALKSVALVAGLSIMSIAQVPDLDPRLLMLSKNFNGSVTRTSVEIGLTGNADCDQTKSFIPDNSKLVTQSFSLKADSNGIGTFSGSAYIITPAGRIVLQGTLKGTVGINTRCGSSRNCTLPWHLEGLFESTPSSMDRAIFRMAANAIAPMMLNFSGDLNPLSASALPIYQGRLDGLVPALPAEVDRITLVQDKTTYLVTDVINATVVNESSETIQTWDKRSFCSIFQLQILDGNQWNDTAFCPFKAPSLPVYIAPNSKFGVQLNPVQTIEPLKAGTYRLALTFRFVSGNIPLSDSYVVQTQEFRMVPLTPTNQVIVATDKVAYQEQEPVALRINNDTDEAILTYDHQSYCSIVTVQRQNGGDWEEVAPCLLGTMTRVVKIPSRDQVDFKLPTESAASKLPQGIYRLEFTYWKPDAEGKPTGNPTTLHSALFSVTGK